MKNRSLTLLAIVLLLLGMRHAAAATAVEKPWTDQPGLDNVYEKAALPVGLDLDSDDESVVAADFSRAGKGLFSAALLNDGLSGERYEEFRLDEVLDGLDYVSSKEVRFEIPNTQFAVVASWGFGGSGNQNLELMLPLPEVPLKLEMNEDAVVAPVNRNTGMLAGFGKILLQNELNKFAVSSEGDLGKILSRFGIAPTLKPRAVFLIKLALLIQHVAKHQDMTFFMNELGFLLCRLVVSGDLSVAGLKNVSLTTLLPKSVIDMINQQAPNLFTLIEKMFVSTKKMFSGVHSDAALAGKKMLVYVFDATQEAVVEFEKYATTVVNDRAVEASLSEFLAASNMEELDWDDLHGLLLPGPKQVVPQLRRSFVGKLVTYGDDLAELVELGFITADEAATMQAGAKVRKFSRGSFVVVLCQADNAFFDIAQTVSATAALVAKASKQYMAVVRKETAQGHDLDQGELLLDKPAERAALRKLLQSEEGMRLQKRLEEAVLAVRNPYEKARLKREQLLNELDVKLDEIEPLKENRAKLVAMKSPAMKTMIADLDGKIELLETRIAELNKELDVLDAQIDGSDDQAKRGKLEKLLKIAKKKSAAGAVVDGDVLQQVKELQRELEKDDQDAAVVQAQMALSSQDKIDLRDAVLREYQHELALVTAELAELDADADITPELIERIAQVGLYKKFLAARVARMQKQQKDLVRLVALKEAVERGTYLDDAQYEAFYDLECELKYILKSNNPVDICRLTKPVESLATRFINELTQPAKNSVFMDMHQSFVRDLANVIARSGIAADNEILVKYFLNMIFPTASQHIVDEIFAQVGAR